MFFLIMHSNSIAKCGNDTDELHLNAIMDKISHLFCSYFKE